jgi:two-component system, cell cycle sensor histidine kinase DivJ
VHNDYTRSYEGAGLGLSLVKGLVALHDGTMTIDSAPDEGTTVTISLPVAGPQPRRTDETRREVGGGGGLGNDGSLRKTA